MDFGLLKGLWVFCHILSFFLLFSGLDNAGKTTILKKFNGEDITTISPTLGFNIKTLEHNGYSLNIWDVGGQKSLRSYWRNYFETTDGLIWVVDSADKRRLEDCKKELHQLLQEEVHARTFYKDHLYKDQLVFVSKLRISTSWQFEG